MSKRIAPIDLGPDRQNALYSSFVTKKLNKNMHLVKYVHMNKNTLFCIFVHLTYISRVPRDY